MFSVNLLWSQLSAMGCAALYLMPAYEISDVQTSFASPYVIYTIFGSLFLMWSLSSLAFLKLINPQYVSTFLSTNTGVQFTVDNFRNGDDFLKSQYTFTRERRLWTSIESEVKQWIQNGWPGWEQSKPDWLTDLYKEIVPDEFVPSPAFRRTGST